MMATADSVKAKIQKLIDLFNQAAGRNETTLVNALFWFLVSIDGPYQPDPVLETLTVTENGTYTPPYDVTGYNQVDVNVQPALESINLTENGLYMPSPGYYGFESVTVDVATYDQGYTDGQNSVDTQSFYDDGYNTGYSEGYEAGRNSVETA